MNLRTRQLEAFRTLAHGGSFAGAAEVLHETTSALSKQIKELEEQLGVRLLDRTTRRLALTAEGRAFLAATERLLDGLDLSVREVRDLAHGRSGHLRFAATPHLAATLLPPVLAAYLRDHPGVGAICHDVAADELLARVASGEAEFAITAFESATEAMPGLRARTLWERREDLVAVMPRDHPLARGRSVRWAALRAYPLVRLRPGRSARSAFDSWLLATGPDWPPVAEAHTVATVLALVAAGIGIAVFPGPAVQAAAPLRIRRIEGASVPRRLTAITREGHSLSGAARLFLEYLARMGRAPMAEGG